MRRVLIHDQADRDPEGARREIEQADEICQPLRLTDRMAQAATVLGRVELWARKPAVAELAFSRAYELFESEGDDSAKSTAAAWLARALCWDGRSAEAGEFIRVAREEGAEDDLATQAYAHAAEGMVLSAAGHHNSAKSSAREAIEMFADAQDPNSLGDLWLDRAEVLRAAGEGLDATNAAQEALRLFELKGNVLAASSVRSFISTVHP